MARVAVVGGGILGVVTSLLASRDGHRVELIESEPEAWAGASAANEGKIHLGPIFALGSRATRELMLSGALSFAQIVEEALDTKLDWEQLCTEPFRYLVMPGSLASVEELGAVYQQINEQLEPGSPRTYLGRPIERIIDTTPRRDVTGLPAFETDERSVEPLRLRQLLLDALVTRDRVALRTGTAVRALRPGRDGARLEFSHGAPEEFDFAVNCAGISQGTLVGGRVRRALNFRLKMAIHLEPITEARTITMVQGPFGDVVNHRDYVYASWYPVGRLSNELAVAPSGPARTAWKSISSRTDLAEAQVSALQDAGVLSGDARIREVTGGFIVGNGPVDIDSLSSELHDRSEFGIESNGPVITPINFKFTTAPLAARRAVQVLASMSRG